MPRYYVSESSPICRSGQSSRYLGLPVPVGSNVWYSTVSNTHWWVHVMIYSWYWLLASSLCLWPWQLCPQNCCSKSRCASSSVQRTHELSQKVFFVTSFGFESRKISVNLLVLDIPSYANSIQSLVCAHCLLGQDTTHVISQMDTGTCEKDRLFSPLLFLRRSRKQHVSQSATGTWLV